MRVLTVQERQVSEILLKSVNRVLPYTYKELANMLTPPVNPRFSLPKIIANVSYLCYELGLPLLSVKVVNQATNKAGIGFYNLYCDLFPNANSIDPNVIERTENDKIRLWNDWSPILNYLEIDIEVPISPMKSKQQVPILDKQIRILPMSKGLEFQNYSTEDIQQIYFLDDLINKQNYFYYFREVGMSCAPNSLVLFQFDNAIVACAVLKETHKYSNPVDGVYKGAFEFFADSIQVFEPICIEKLQSITPEIIRFSQVKQRIAWNKLKDIQNLILQKQLSLYPNEINVQNNKTFFEGAKKQVVVNAHERNPAARRECIGKKGTRCVVCGFDFGEFYGDQFNGKIHVHHLNPIHLQSEEYSLNPEKDLIPVCPNCHMILHSKFGSVFTIDEVKKFICDQQNKKIV